MYFLWQDLSYGTIIFDLVKLTLKFDLLLKNFNLGHNFRTRRDKAFILHVCIPCDKTFHMHGTIIFDLVTLTLKFDLLLKNFNHGFYLVMVGTRRASLSSDNCYDFYAPSSIDRGHIVFVLSVCLLSSLTSNFLTVGDRDFIFGMRTPLLMSYWMKPRSMTL